jgi:hypothetical protein
MEHGPEQELRESIAIIYGERFGAMPDALRAALDHVRGEGVLLGLLAITALSPRDEADAALHRAAGVS